MAFGRSAHGSALDEEAGVAALPPPGAPPSPVGMPLGGGGTFFGGTTLPSPQPIDTSRAARSTGRNNLRMDRTLRMESSRTAPAGRLVADGGQVVHLAVPCPGGRANGPGGCVFEQRA